MAENAGNSVDKASWLRLAASWLGMIRNEPRRFLGAEDHDGPGAETGGRAWPRPSEKDSKVAH